MTGGREDRSEPLARRGSSDVRQGLEFESIIDPDVRDTTAGNAARDKAIDLALSAIDKQFGKGAIMRLARNPIDREVHVVRPGRSASTSHSASAAARAAASSRSTDRSRAARRP